MIVAITGTQELDQFPWGAHVIAHAIRGLPEADEWVTGGAHGVDTAAARFALHVFGYRKHRVICPHAPHNERHVTYMAGRGATIEYAEQGATRSASYMNRNTALVEAADLLLAFPASGKESIRSGTWSTVRRARKRRIEVRVHPLDVSRTWVEYRDELS